MRMMGFRMEQKLEILPVGKEGEGKKNLYELRGVCLVSSFCVRSAFVFTLYYYCYLSSVMMMLMMMNLVTIRQMISTYTNLPVSFLNICYRVGFQKDMRRA